jgi:hypothetical protein
MTHREKGAASGLAMTLIVLILIAIIGIGFWWYHGATTSADDTTVAAAASSTQGYTFTIATTTVSAPNTGTETVTGANDTYTATPAKTKTVTYTTYERRPVASAYSATTGLSGSTYHNGTYGLTLRLPSAGWTSYMTSGGPSGLPGTAQIHFRAPGEATDAFVVNVWSKAGWNYVRTQENFVHLNTSNIGEGTYLGENFTWIYSDTVYSHAAEAQAALSGAVFY